MIRIQARHFVKSFGSAPDLFNRGRALAEFSLYRWIAGVPDGVYSLGQGAGLSPSSFPVTKRNRAMMAAMESVREAKHIGILLGSGGHTRNAIPFIQSRS